MQDPNQHAAQREELEREIRAAFAGVTCEGGHSWLRAKHNDGGLPEYLYGDEPPFGKHLEELDDWTKLIDDEAWDPFPGVGGFGYIDHIGFRYYLPTAMIRCLHGNNTEWYPGHFLEYITRFCDASVTWHYRGTTTDVWTHAQLVCIGRFIAWMAVEEEARIEAEYQFLVEENRSLELPTDHLERDENPWAEAIKGEWAKYLRS